ncbi:hypothetical protein [Sporosarcina cyprini]|uniref:hypothetical protein n=1 Tax=Sporosarcina cyprini TaxID=2910523 RepID=UPI001EDD2590|nr:hypothetical protein [Sporosarcina cyprini]MCG3089712.1 hypothetical protein [Sporosarcina cyprini]
MFFNKLKNPYSGQPAEITGELEELYPVILYFTPTAVYVYEDKTDSHVIHDGGHIELWDDYDTVWSGTYIVTYVHKLQQALDRYKVDELGLLVVPLEHST